MHALQLLEFALASLSLLRDLHLNRRKGSAVSDLPQVAAAAPAPVATAPAVNPTAVVNSVVQTVTAHPAIEPSKAPGVIASILAGLYQAEPAIFALTRSSSKTQAEVGLGLGLAEIIVAAFVHPAGE